jgi:gamma-glutamyltranspeptidase
MYEHLYDRITTAAARLKYCDASVGLFLKDDRKTPRVAVGEPFANPDLANTLERLASHGVEDFYSDLLADEIVAGARHFTTCFTSTQADAPYSLHHRRQSRDSQVYIYIYIYIYI